jgi:hypothetical protein
MRFHTLLLVLLVVPARMVYSQAAAPGTLGLQTEQVPSECKSVEGNFPVDIQTAILWDKTELYKSVVPLPIAKRAQSFACQKQKGTVYFFQYSSQQERETAAKFIKGLLWGEPGPTSVHPELVLEGGDLMTVVSFQQVPKTLLRALQEKKTSAAAVGGEERTLFPIPGHGNFRLSVPDGWKAQSRALADPPSTALHFIPKQGDAFDVQVTAVWLDPSKVRSETPDELQSEVKRTSDELLPRAVEKAATLHELHGPNGLGFYYALTDSQPGPGEFAYLTQGNFLTGEVLTVFTVLVRTPASPDVDQALRAITESSYGSQ